MKSRAVDGRIQPLGNRVHLPSIGFSRRLAVGKALRAAVPARCSGNGADNRIGKALAPDESIAEGVSDVLDGRSDVDILGQPHGSDALSRVLESAEIEAEARDAVGAMSQTSIDTVVEFGLDAGAVDVRIRPTCPVQIERSHLEGCIGSGMAFRDSVRLHARRCSQPGELAGSRAA